MLLLNGATKDKECRDPDLSVADRVDLDPDLCSTATRPHEWANRQHCTNATVAGANVAVNHRLNNPIGNHTLGK